MSSQNIAIDVCCFDGVADIKKVMDELQQADPAAYSEAQDALKNVDWAGIRRLVAKETLQAFAEEQGWKFAEGAEASDVFLNNRLPIQGGIENLVGVVYRQGWRGEIQLGVSIEPNQTCQCFDYRRESGENHLRNDKYTTYQQKPVAQTRFEELHRNRMAEVVMKIVLGTEADDVKVTSDGTTIMCFPILNEEV